MIDFIKFEQILESNYHNCSCSCFPCRKMNDCKKCDCKDCKCKYCKCKDNYKMIKNDPKSPKKKVAYAKHYKDEDKDNSKGTAKKKILSSLDDKISRRI